MSTRSTPTPPLMSRVDGVGQRLAGQRLERARPPVRAGGGNRGNATELEAHGLLLLRQSREQRVVLGTLEPKGALS
ncbi:hypothetical protein [Archangium lipolyticum]|uniref:hypothetical protein n=1 Tax=Archangium lipolyticum TaxID=2970465 RepID=UPI002149C367|nr:hypothetical protein [Archangium lipolyticum]